VRPRACVGCAYQRCRCASSSRAGILVQSGVLKTFTIAFAAQTQPKPGARRGVGVAGPAHAGAGAGGRAFTTEPIGTLTGAVRVAAPAVLAEYSQRAPYLCHDARTHARTDGRTRARTRARARARTHAGMHSHGHTHAHAHAHAPLADEHNVLPGRARAPGSTGEYIVPRTGTRAHAHAHIHTRTHTHTRARTQVA
jgi:hypothetical protein